MFRVNLTDFDNGTRETVQITQDIRLAVDRTKASIEALVANSAGDWFKTGSTKTKHFQGKLEELRDMLQKTSEGFEAADTDLQGKVSTAYQGVFSAAGATAPSSILALNDSWVGTVSSCHGSLTSSASSLGSSIAAAKSSLTGLENSGSIASPLDSLQSNLTNVNGVIKATHTAFEGYCKAVDNFEETYASVLSPNAISPGAAAVASNALSDIKGGLGIIKHLVTIGGFWASVLDGSWKYETTLETANLVMGHLNKVRIGHTLWSATKDGWKGFKEGFTGAFDAVRPSKWKENWDQLTSGVIAAKEAGKDGADDALLNTIGKGGTAGKWSNRLAAGGKLVGYAADVISLAKIGVDSIKATGDYSRTSDKIAAAGTEAAFGVAKFVVGKAAGKAGSAIGATIGSAILPPVGTIVGGIVGGAIAGWAANKGMSWIEGKCKGSIVSGLGKVNRGIAKGASSIGKGISKVGKRILKGWRK